MLTSKDTGSIVTFRIDTEVDEEGGKSSDSTDDGRTVAVGERRQGHSQDNGIVVSFSFGHGLR
jgi:hypothetical protein